MIIRGIGLLKMGRKHDATKYNIPYKVRLKQALRKVFEGDPAYTHTFSGWGFALSLIIYIISMFEGNISLTSMDLLFWSLITASVVSILSLKVKTFFWFTYLSLSMAMIIALSTNPR